MSLNDFVVLHKLGDGAYSSVHKVKRISDGQIYALKKVKIKTTQVKLIGLKEKYKQNALNEVRLLASITSDYIIKYKYSFFDSKSNTLCIVLEYAEGGDLEKLINNKKKSLGWIEEKEIWKMVRHVLSGLTMLHDRNIIHRDLKGANIFLSQGVYKIADLNVSKLMKKSLAYTQTGTPFYASPEVWQDKPYELKSDIWSLGCIVYYLCSLKPPFTATTMEGLYRKVLRGVYPPIPGTYSVAMMKFLSSCLEVDPKKRLSCRYLQKLIPISVYYPASNDERINLLDTIKIPKNNQNWKDYLPKADYDKSESSPKEIRYGYLSEHKLKDIVMTKLTKHHSLHKSKEIMQMCSEENIEELNMSRERDKSVKLPPLMTPPIIVQTRAEQGGRMDVIMRIKEGDKQRRYDYNRPVWWG